MFYYMDNNNNYHCKMCWNKLLRWFDTTQFSYHCVHPINAKVFSIQMLLHFSQIVPRVCTLVLFIRTEGNLLTTMFPNLSTFSNVCSSITVSNASIERSLSQMKVTKHRLRSLIGEKSLLNLIKIAIESPL